MEYEDNICNKTCRTCAKYFSKKLSPLFKDEKILAVRFIHTEEYNVEINKNDGLPQNICYACFQELSRLNTFLMKCKKSEEILLKQYKTFDTSQTICYYKDEYNIKAGYSSDNESVKECNIDNKENSRTSKTIHLVIKSLQSAELESKIENDGKNDISVVNTSSRETSVELENNYIDEEGNDVEIKNVTNKAFDIKKPRKRNIRSCSVRSNAEKDTYTCTSCDKVFNKVSQYKHHRKMHSKSIKSVRESYLCDLCGKEISKRESLSDHKNTHLGIKPYKCEICEKSFAVKNALRSHVLKHSRKETFTCETCGRVYTSKSYYQEHLMLHKNGSLLENNERPFKCPHCPRSFKLLSTLTSHCNFHSKTTDRKYHCTECNTTFKRSDHLKEHINGVHLKIFSFKCHICSKLFVTGALRNAHIKRYHSGIRYKCDECEKDFSLSTSLSRHKRLHNQDKRFICEICNMSFVTVYQIEKHMVTHKIDETTKNGLITKTYEKIAKAFANTI